MMNGSVSFITEDAKHLSLESNSVDLVVTQAPFYKVDFDRYGGDSEKQIGSEKNIKRYINSLVIATKEMERVLKPTGSIFVVLSNMEPTASEYLLKVLKKTDLLLANAPFVWNWSDENKQKVMGSIQFDYDLIFHFVKSPSLIYSNPYLVKKYSEPIWNVPFLDISSKIVKKLETVCFIGNSFNPEIPKRLIEMFSKPGALVLDPFGGSGTTACEAYLLNRKAISVDVSEEQTELAEIRLGFIKEQQ
jgi:DNA modification methylase